MTHDLFPCCKFELLIFVVCSSRVMGWASRCWLCCVILPIMIIRVREELFTSPPTIVCIPKNLSLENCVRFGFIWEIETGWALYAVEQISGLILSNNEDLKCKTINCGIYHSLGIQNKNCKYRKDRESVEIFFLIGMAYTKSTFVV